MVVEAQGSKRTTKTTLRSERSSVLKKDLTGPTLLEMSGLRTNRDLTAEDSPSGNRSLRFGFRSWRERDVLARQLCRDLPEVFHQHDVSIPGLTLGIEKRFAIGRQGQAAKVPD